MGLQKSSVAVCKLLTRFLPRQFAVEALGHLKENADVSHCGWLGSAGLSRLVSACLPSPLSPFIWDGAFSPFVSLVGDVSFIQDPVGWPMPISLPPIQVLLWLGFNCLGSSVV